MPARKNTAQTLETRAKISATMKARGIRPPVFRGGRTRTRPARGTSEYTLFRKIESVLNAAAAHAELRRGA